MNHFIFLDLKEKWETLSKKAASIGDEIMLNAKETVAEWLKHNSGESERKKFKNKAFNALNRYEGLVDMDFSSFCKIMRMNPECVEALARFGNANLGYVDIVQESDFLEIQNLLKINSVLKR